MCEMCHAVATCGERHEEFDGCVAHYKPLGLDRDRQWEYEYALLGIEQSEGEQYAVDGSRCSHCGPGVEECGVALGHEHGLREVEAWNHVVGKHVELTELGQFLEQSGTYAAHDIVEQKFAWSPCGLHNASEERIFIFLQRANILKNMWLSPPCANM